VRARPGLVLGIQLGSRSLPTAPSRPSSAPQGALTFVVAGRSGAPGRDRIVRQVQSRPSSRGVRTSRASRCHGQCWHPQDGQDRIPQFLSGGRRCGTMGWLAGVSRSRPRMLRLEDRFLIKDMHRRGMTISGIAHVTGHDRKMIRAVLNGPVNRTQLLSSVWRAHPLACGHPCRRCPESAKKNSAGMELAVASRLRDQGTTATDDQTVSRLNQSRPSLIACTT